jgi:hypothetical protein
VFKPFSPPGASTLADSVPLIHDFATVVSLLNAGPTDLILDVGAVPAGHRNGCSG